MSDPSNGDEDVDTDRLRRRRMGWIVGVGMAAAVALALLAGIWGATGRAGAAIFLLLTAGSCAVSASYGVVTAVIDDVRDVPVSRRRVAWVVVLFFAGAALMAMTAGVGG